MVSLDHFEKLTAIAERVELTQSVMQAFAELDVEATVLAVYDVDVVEEMLLSAAYRLAERKGLGVIRVNVDEGIPSFYLSLGHTQENAQSRLREYFERQQEERRTEIPE